MKTVYTMTATNRFHYDTSLGINNLDPSHAVLPGGDLRKWLGDLKIMTTRAFQTYRDQTGAPGCDPSEATVGANPVLLYAVRLTKHAAVARATAGKVLASRCARQGQSTPAAG